MIDDGDGKGGMIGSGVKWPSWVSGQRNQLMRICRMLRVYTTARKARSLSKSVHWEASGIDYDSIEYRYLNIDIPNHRNLTSFLFFCFSLFSIAVNSNRLIKMYCMYWDFGGCSFRPRLACPVRQPISPTRPRPVCGGTTTAVIQLTTISSDYG